ncbi:MAG TPA: acyl carrier protein [Alphaproteobacteria bacterium]|nr:acyl carrier protein [Alphaproteobacteria bacterium]
MTEDEIKAVLFEEITAVAPDADPAVVPEEADIRDALDLDSMDMLNVVAALHDRLGVEIPEADAPAFFTIAGGVQYLASRLH